MATSSILNSGRPLWIAGPCSAESPDQLREVALQLKQNNGVHLLRAGIWKPRTRPNSFEGKGKEALQWLSEVQADLDLPAITEVATAQHVEDVISAGLTHVWIGARTTVNPFSVQDIVDALKGTGATVFVKNPIHADVDLWQGSIERFLNAGIEDVAAVHRGFSSFMNSEYRNLPMWNLPIELQRRFPQLPIICDPSHIAGKRELVSKVAQKAFDLNFAGLMVEVHPNPEGALSDPDQQLTPASYLEMVKTLRLPEDFPEDELWLNQLEELRSKIDKVDEDFLSTLASRFDIVNRIGDHKHENNIAVLQLERWNEILKSRSFLGEKLGLSEPFVKRLMELIHQESIRIQSEINSKEKAR